MKKTTAIAAAFSLGRLNLSWEEIKKMRELQEREVEIKKIVYDEKQSSEIFELIKEMPGVYEDTKRALLEGKSPIAIIAALRKLKHVLE